MEALHAFTSIELPYAEVPEDATILIALGNGKIRPVEFQFFRAKRMPPRTKRLMPTARRALDDRKQLAAAGKLPALAPASQAAADKSYLDTIEKTGTRPGDFCSRTVARICYTRIHALGSYQPPSPSSRA